MKRAKNLQADLQNQLACLDQTMKTLQQQRDDIKYINDLVKKWAQSFDKVERNNQGVPYIRNIKEICGRMREMLFDVHGDLDIKVQRLSRGDVPCFMQVYEALDLVKKQTGKIVGDESSYKATYVEELRQILGRIIGITNTIMKLYFEE